MGGTKKKGSSIIHECLQGEIKVEHEQKVKKESKSQAGRKGKGKGKGKAADDRYETKITHTKTSFLYISLDLPAAPLFQDAKDRTMIPQIPLFELLSKFDGQTEAIQPDGSIKRYSIVKLPRYLMLHAKRFQHNNWFVEKNPTLVTFPLKNLDMRFFKAKRSRPSLEKLGSFPVPALKKLIKKYRLTAPAQVVEKRELVEVLDRFYEGAGESKEVTKYDLIANLCHEGKPGKGAYKVHIHQRSCNTWYEMQDLHVWSTETMPQLVALSETYIQVYELHQK